MNSYWNHDSYRIATHCGSIRTTPSPSCSLDLAGGGSLARLDSSVYMYDVKSNY